MYPYREWPELCMTAYHMLFLQHAEDCNSNGPFYLRYFGDPANSNCLPYPEPTKGWFTVCFLKSKTGGVLSTQRPSCLNPFILREKTFCGPYRPEKVSDISLQFVGFPQIRKSLAHIRSRRTPSFKKRGADCEIKMGDGF